MIRICVPLLFSFIALAQGFSHAGTHDPCAARKLQLKIDQAQLRLEGLNRMCVIIASTDAGSITRYNLDIPWPCYFHTDKAGNIRKVQEAGDVYVLLESSIRKGLNDCETYLQAIRVRDSSIKVSQHKDRVASCPPFQWDVILFKELFD